jgi:hypothetical protein
LSARRVDDRRGWAKTFGQSEPESVEQQGLRLVGSDHAANAQFAARIFRQGQYYVGALDPAEFIENGPRAVAQSRAACAEPNAADSTASASSTPLSLITAACAARRKHQKSALPRVFSRGRQKASLLPARDPAKIFFVLRTGEVGLAEILKVYATLEGILYDQLQVVAHPDYLIASGMHDRCEVVGGNFVEAMPHGADAYVLKRIIHDWDDDICVGILRRWRDTVSHERRVIVVDPVVPASNEFHFSKPRPADDGSAGGRDRTEADFQSLFKRACCRRCKTNPGSQIEKWWDGPCPASEHVLRRARSFEYPLAGSGIVDRRRFRLCGSCKQFGCE